MKTEKGTTRVNWAEELGIDLRELREESFDHPRNVKEHKRQAKKAASYWEWKGNNGVRR
jgi:hypothetical protein